MPQLSESGCRGHVCSGINISKDAAAGLQLSTYHIHHASLDIGQFGVLCQQISQILFGRFQVIGLCFQGVVEAQFLPQQINRDQEPMMVAASWYQDLTVFFPDTREMSLIRPILVVPGCCEDFYVGSRSAPYGGQSINCIAHDPSVTEDAFGSHPTRPELRP